MKMYRQIVKPFFDIFFAVLLMIISFPVLILVIFVLSFANNGKPFYTQERPGKNGKLFKLIKFKTMTDKVDQDGKLLPDKYRITRIGKLIRSFSIDELPQIFNILMGQMSFVGPRPLLKGYLELYNSTQARRHEVKPGLTGWAQVNGRNNTSWKERFEHDIYYVDNISFLLDLRILFLTIRNVILRQGINSSSEGTMTVFKGNY